MRTDAAPIIAVVDTGIIDGPNGLFTRDRFLSMGAVRVVAASAPLVGPEQLPAFFLSVRRMAGNGPLFVVTTRPEWAFGVLRLFHRLCDGVVLWGDARPPPAAESAPWGRLFATASRMEGSDAPDVGMRVLVRLELPTLGHLSEALLVGRRWRHWEPLGPRWPTAPAPRNAAPPEIFSMPSGGFLVSDASGLRMVAQAPKGSVGSFVGSAPTKPETGAGDGVAGRLLTAARLMFGDDGLLLAWRDRHTPTEYGTHLSIIGTLVARWRLILESERLLAAKDAAGFRALMDAAELDAWKAGVLGVSRLVGVACRPVDAAWFEACVGRVAVALTAGGDGTLPAPSEGGGARRMVVHVSQLLGLKHAPTALLLSMVDGVLKQDPSVELLIAVEECLVPSPDEDVVRAMRRANVSSALRGDHVAWMSERGWERRVRFHYANTGDTRRQRTADLLDAVGQFAPEAVIGIGTDASIARVVLHERYPYLAVSLGGGPACGRCHVYVPSMPAAVMEASWPEGLRRPPAIRELALHVETPTPLRPWGRGDLGLPEEATVLVTVGNRLRWEVSDDFLALVLGLLEARPNLRWVLVGDEVELLAPRIPARLADRVRLHGYEKDLSGLLTVCDLYVNPFRSGGGISVSMAMNAGIAVLVRGDSTDGRYWVGDAAEAWDAEGYRRALERLATDAEARRENGRHVKARIATFSAERSSRRLMDLIEESKAIFKARGATVS